MHEALAPPAESAISPPPILYTYGLCVCVCVCVCVCGMSDTGTHPPCHHLPCHLLTGTCTHALMQATELGAKPGKDGEVEEEEQPGTSGGWVWGGGA